MRPYLPFQRSQERKSAHPTRRWTGATLLRSPPGLPADHKDGTTSQNADCCSSSMAIIPETRLKVNTNRLKTVAVGCIFLAPTPFRRATASTAMGTQQRGPGGVAVVDSDTRGHSPALVPRPHPVVGQDIRVTSKVVSSEMILATKRMEPRDASVMPSRLAAQAAKRSVASSWSSSVDAPA